MWVFGYGSLIWNPGFNYQERSVATLANHHRSFCILSTSARGTPQQTGLGLALTKQPGAQCQGVAFHVSPQDQAPTLAYLREREAGVYLETTLDVSLSDGRIVPAVTFVADTGHTDFVGGLSQEEQAARISKASGQLGSNSDYLFSTVESLNAFGIKDAPMSNLARHVRELRRTQS
ncbi:gamma-glutamylcyclotransferase [Tropicibacter sp. R15_0]|uniref:gamma-glutamylcyclotransferase n=1 Tax=Tropicibacter sp. R15_0 TaxID=2821101 RepID=UPI001ADC7034|nr:gamma-glutamylcyclotransferase [Tropicibacter sp. R15_0]MBO9468162.1 gamma-glutamylcyclotransferase [Tropicibacter sp. R15_0]